MLAQLVGMYVRLRNHLVYSADMGRHYSAPLRAEALKVHLQECCQCLLCNGIWDDIPREIVSSVKLVVNLNLCMSNFDDLCARGVLCMQIAWF